MSMTEARPEHLAHHFSEVAQQKESAKLGMWLFLLTEILLFSGLFCVYAIFRSWHPDMFYNAHKHLDIVLGTVNTIVLITSSLTMVLAIRSIQLGKRRNAIINLSLTLAFATIFLIVKYFEYSHKFHLGQLPGKYYTFTGIEGNNPHLFFGIYFAMTSLHALHILAGMGAIIWVLVAQIDLGGWNVVVALLVAAIKSTMVALIFMHLLYDKKLYLVVFFAAILFLAIFIVLTMFDTMRRDDIYSIMADPIEKKAAIYDSTGNITDSLAVNHDSVMNDSAESEKQEQEN